ncbi:hypothetical protein [Amycolatopsis sp. MEPSY49]|uniref:hypothetical protein n=1 Tax=Amycolatopsis sp. MEPSY49 TaxID=3151600 RepID=UPI003EF7216F
MRQAGLGDPDGVRRLVELAGEVTHAGADVGEKGRVIRRFGEPIRLAEVTLSVLVLAAVVRHPPRDLCQ